MASVSGTHDALVDLPITNDGWFPDLNLQDWQEVYRIPAEIAPDTMLQQLTLGMAEVNADLADWAAIQQAIPVEWASFTPLQDALYREAVYARAYVWLIPMLKTLYFTQQGEQLDDEKATKEGDFIQRADRAMNTLRRSTDPTVDVIGGDARADVL